MSDPVGNPKDRLSRDAAHYCKLISAGIDVSSVSRASQQYISIKRLDNNNVKITLHIAFKIESFHVNSFGKKETWSCSVWCFMM